MHRSKLAAFVIDCKTNQLEAATKFWSEALGRPIAPPAPDDEGKYRDLQSAASEPVIMVQKVEHDSRIHLDIETDNIEAEVARLEALGAKRIEKVRTWIVMEAPTGQRFCVVRPQRGEIVLGASMWPSTAELPKMSGEYHDQLAKLVGTYHGLTKTWLDPNEPPSEDIAEMRIELILGGRWIRAQTSGSLQGKPHAGEFLLGFHKDANRFEQSWVDSFHTGSAIMVSTGSARTDHVIAVTGSYQAGAQTWGWRNEWHLGETLVTKAVNIAPDGTEYPALETRWKR